MGPRLPDHVRACFLIQGENGGDVVVSAVVSVAESFLTLAWSTPAEHLPLLTIVYVLADFLGNAFFPSVRTPLEQGTRHS